MRLMLMVKKSKLGVETTRHVLLELTKEQAKKIAPKQSEIHNPRLHYFYFIEGDNTKEEKV